MRRSKETVCVAIFDIIKSSFQQATTSELTVADLTERMRESMLRRGAKVDWLTTENVYQFTRHLPQNFGLEQTADNIGDAVVHFRALLHSPTCVKSGRSCPAASVVRLEGQLNEKGSVRERKSAVTAPEDVLNESCALIMRAFMELGCTNVSLLQLRKFLISDVSSRDGCSYFVHEQSLEQFLSSRPYLFEKAGKNHYSMYDMRTAWTIVSLNNAVWKEGRSVRLAPLAELAAQIEPTMKDVAKLECFLSYHKRLFAVEGDMVSVQSQICGFERAHELMERLG